MEADGTKFCCSTSQVDSQVERMERYNQEGCGISKRITSCFTRRLLYVATTRQLYHRNCMRDTIPFSPDRIPNSHSSRRSLSTRRQVLLALPYRVERVASDGTKGSIPLGNACSSPLLLSCFRFTYERHNVHVPSILFSLLRWVADPHRE